MRIYKYTFVCVLSLLLAACWGGIDAWVDDSVELLGGPGEADLNAEVWYQAGSYKSVLQWDSIAGSESYNLFWAGNVTYDDLGTLYAYLSGIAGTITVGEFQEQLEALGIAVSYGDAGTAATGYEHLDLSEERSYCYMVTGMAGDEPVGSTDIECISTLAIPTLTTASASGSVTISWLSVGGAAKYYVFRSVLSASTSINVSKATILNDSECEGVEPDVFVGETVELAMSDDDNGEMLSNCLDYCYTVVPEDENGHIIQGETQVKLARPEVEGVVEKIWVFDSLSGPFTDVAVTANDEIIVSHDSGSVIKYAWNGNEIWETDLTQTHDLWGASALELYGDSVYVAVSLGESYWFSYMGVCKVSENSGALDLNFGDGGCASVSDDTSEATDIAIDSNGRILISGNEKSLVAETEKIYACRFHANGDVDLEFGSEGGKGGKGGGCYTHPGLPGKLIDAFALTTYSDGGEERVAIVGTQATTELELKGLIVLLDSDGIPVDIDNSSLSVRFYDVTAAADGSLFMTGITSVILNGIVANYGVSPLNLIDSAVYSDDIAYGSVIGKDCRGKPVIGGSFDGDIAGAARLGDLDDLTSLLLDDGFGTGGILFLHEHLGSTDETYGFAYSPNSGNYVFVGVLDAFERWKPFMAIVY